MHFVVDIETLGNGNDAAIASIGVTTMSKITHSDESMLRFAERYMLVDIQSCINAGLRVDGPTIEWWLKQPEAARAEISGEGAGKRSINIRRALHDLHLWMQEVEPNIQDRYVWSHGATFDIPILANAYRAINHDMPWQFRNVRDTRTLFDLAGDFEAPSKDEYEPRHHALTDARWAADAIAAAYRSLGKEAEWEGNGR